MTEDTRTSGTSKSTFYLTMTSSFLQPILSWNSTDSPSSSDYCVLTVNVKRKIQNPKLQSQNSTSTKQTGNSLHQMTHGRISQIHIDHNLLKLLPKILIKKIQISSKSSIPVIEIKNTSQTLGGAVNYKSYETKDKGSTKYSRKLIMIYTTSNRKKA